MVLGCCLPLLAPQPTSDSLGDPMGMQGVISRRKIQLRSHRLPLVRCEVTARSRGNPEQAFRLRLVNGGKQNLSFRSPLMI